MLNSHHGRSLYLEALDHVMSAVLQAYLRSNPMCMLLLAASLVDQNRVIEVRVISHDVSQVSLTRHSVAC